jgi:glycosyltransferase involved in cell wall biosynthesis
MRLALIADAFPPLRTSGAVQLRDLSREFSNQGHEITVILPSSEIGYSWLLEDMEGVRVLRLRAPKTKDVNYIRRTFAEFFMPFFMRRNLHNSPLAKERWDGVVWYSPSIFHGPLVRAIKLASNCKSYLIIRDIFPQWAADMGLMSKRGLIYLFFNAVARYQYSVADILGVQTPGNLDYFKDWAVKSNRKLQVLQNWLFDSPTGECSISLANTKLVGRKIFVYAGNMGVAQGVGAFLDLAELLQERLDVGFLFVGRGSDAAKLAEDERLRGLNNVLLYDEIHPDEIPGLYAQCAVGLVALDPRHSSHNIPGKFLTYMQAGLPVLARINAGNDLVKIIQDNNIGGVSVGIGKNSLEIQALELLDLIDADASIRDRCRALYLKLFSPEMAVKQIVCALEDKAEAI